MDQNTVTALAAVVGSGGLSGALVQYIALRKDRIALTKWRSEMAIRIEKQQAQIEELRRDSPQALIARIQESEDFRQEDGRRLDRHLERLTKGLREVMGAVAEIRTVLKLPAV